MMKKVIKSLFAQSIFCMHCVLYSPLILLFKLYDRDGALSKERDYWNATVFPNIDKGGVMMKLLNLREYRSVLYYRLGGVARCVRWLAPGQVALHIHCRDIGTGLVIQHGHSTRIGAVSIGERCQIWHNVTIGTNRSHSGNLPTIGNDVKICAGAIVLGNIVIGDNVTIGAGSVVVKSVPSDSVVVGNPARIIKRCR